MTRKQFIEQLEENFKQVIETVEKKNQDYAGDNDPFKNFRFAEMVGIPVHRAILVRMSDKLARISNVIDKDVAVKDEKVWDTLQDLMAYTNILSVYLNEQKTKK